MDRHLNEVIFVKCFDETCCGDFHLQELLEFFWGTDKVKFPFPILSEDHKGDYKTFLEETVNENKKYDHVGQLSSQENISGKCDHCTYYFKFKTEKQRHLYAYH